MDDHGEGLTVAPDTSRSLLVSGLLSIISCPVRGGMSHTSANVN